MDVQVVVIGAVVFVISAVLIYLISAFTMKEKTFEEVIAEQKRQQEAEKEKAKLEKKQEKDVRRKFKKKEKGKDKSPQSSPHGSASDHEGKDHKMVEYELEPEIIEPLEVKPLKQSKKKEKPAKSILHNKDEKTPVVPESLMQQIIHTGPPPKDDLELKHIHEREKEQKAKKEKQIKHETEVKAKPVIVEEMVMKKETQVHSAAPPVVESRASFKQQGDHGDIEKDNSDLITSVKTTGFSDGELQSLIDILLSKQGASGYASDWNKKSHKGDPVTLLKKQLEEKERSLQEAQQMAMSADTKLKEIRHDLNQEKMHSHNLDKSYAEKLENQKLEVQALQTRMQHTHEQHMVETSQMRSRIQQLEAQAGDQNRVQRMAEENQMLRESLAKTQAESASPSEMNNLKQQVSIMEKALSDNALKLNTSENLKKSLEQKVAKYEKELKDKDNSQKNNAIVIEKRLEEVTQELRKTEGKNSSLHNDLQSANSSLDTAHKECVSLKVKLQELEQSLTGSDQAAKEKEEKLREADRTKIDMEGNLKNLQKKIEDYERDHTQISAQIQALKQENLSLSEDLKVTKEKQQKEIEDLSKAGAPNGDIHAEEEMKLRLTVTEHEKEISEKATEITKLKSEVDGKKTELSSLQRELDIQKKKNNELREKNWKAMDALNKAESSLSEKIKSAVKTNMDELNASQAELETNDKAVLQRLFPDIAIKDINVHKDWMSKFEKEASGHLQSLSKPQPDNSAKYEKSIHELETKITDLEKQLEEQQSSKTDTSEFEVKISDLEQKLADSQQELAKLEKSKTDTVELENKIRELERRAKEDGKSRESLQAQIQEYDSSYTKLQTQATQYRSVLGETENKLTQLESSVESEEKKWQDRLQSREVELDQTKAEVKQLREELIKSKGSQEMKLEVETLKEQLQGSEDKCSQLQSEVKEAQEKIVEYKIQIEETQKTTVTINTLSDDLEELRRQLEAEKKKNKDLASNVVKLNGIIKTGHDALTQEQNLVEQLRKQLASGNHANSVVPNEAGSEVQELKAKLGEKEKQLEKEISANNLLKQRLASSQSSLNETGTSV